MNPPQLRPDGACPDCLGVGLCAYHQAETHQRERHRANQIRLAVHGLRESEIASIMARNELESDEFFTAREKALGIIRKDRR